MGQSAECAKQAVSKHKRPRLLRITMDGSERDSDTTLGSWVSVSGNQEDNAMSLGGSSDDNSSNDNDPNPARQEHEMQVVLDDTAGGERSTQLDASNTNDDNDENIDGSDGDGGSSSSSGFVIPTARPLVLDYEHVEVHPASGGTQRRRKGHHHQEQQQQQQSDHQSQSQHSPTQPPSRIRRRSTHTSSILLNPLYVFGTFTVVAYLMRPNSSQISSTPGTDADASFGSAKFYDDPWDQGEDFRDRSPIPDELKRKQARTEKALAARRKKMEEEEEARRKNTTSSADDEGEDEGEVGGVEGPGDEDKEEETPGEETLSEETSGANETKSETEANVTSINITSFEAIVDPFPQLYDWQNWTTRLANETKSETFATDPIFLWFAPQSGGGAFVKILEDCYEGINITRSQWWRYETPDDADAMDSANAGANSWWWQYDTTPLDDTSATEDGRLPIMATTNLLEAASSAFNSSAGRGRCISLFMHPIERAIRSYHHHRMIFSRTPKSNASATSNSTSNITLGSYAQGPFTEENRLVRSIADRNSSEALKWEDLEVAMDFVTRKCLVGVIGDKRNLLIRTVALIEMALGLTKRERNSTRCTAERIEEWADSMHEISNQRIDLPSDDAEAWGALMRKNAYDMKLYEKITELFANQTALLDETRTSRSKVKSTAMNQNDRTDNDTIPATENKSEQYIRSTNSTDASEGVMADALDNSRVDEEVDDEIEGEEEEDKRADDDEENIDHDESEKTGKGDDNDGEVTDVEDSNVK